MKKTILSLITLIIGLLLISCAGSEPKPDPSDYVVQDIAQYAQERQITITDDSGSNILGYARVDAYNSLMEKFKDYELEILETNVSDDSDECTVKVRLTTYAFGDAFTEATNELSAMVDVGLIDVEDTVTLANYYVEKMSSIGSRDYSKIVTLNCVYKDNEWHTDTSGNEELLNALSGGLNSGI